MSIALALLIAAAAPASSGPTAEIHSPPGGGEITLAYIEIGDGAYVDTFAEEVRFDDGTTGFDLGKPVFAHSARIIRRFAGPRLPPDVIVRRIWRHASTGLIGRMRFLAFLERTDKGYYFVQWSVRPNRLRACMPADIAAHFQMAGGVPGEGGEVCLALRD